MILEKGIPENLLVKAYWFRASNEHIYAVFLDDKKYRKDGTILSVNAIACEIDTNNIDNDVDFTKFKNGDEVKAFSLYSDWILEILIYPKYYFPKFNEEKNQWYHKEDDNDADWMDDFTFILKETYKIALKKTGLKTY